MRAGPLLIGAALALLTVSLARGQDLAAALILRQVPIGGQALSQDWAPGVLTFRGTPDRRGVLDGSLPKAPRVIWRRGPFCGPSTDQYGTRQWCGTGWTGQPAIRPLPNQKVEVIFGAYDHALHFLDGATGQDLRPPFKTGDIIKGAVSLDPTGAPLIYTGSRDDFLRILRLEPQGAVELWRLNGNVPDGIWNNDWDASPLVLGDWMFQGGENGWFHVVHLNRAADVDGTVSVSPVMVNRIAGFTPELFAAVGDRMASIETSTMFNAGRIWFSNSAGLVQGYSAQALIEGKDRATALEFEYQAGDDVDATLVGGPEGEIYVAVEDERPPSAAKSATGHLARLNPDDPENPVVWSVVFPGTFEGDGGLWATPALYDGFLYVQTHAGGLYTLDAATGAIVDMKPMAGHGWSSPVVVGNALLVGGCDGDLMAFDLADPAHPTLRWRFHPEGAGCWESTPAVWQGVIYLGNRNGYVYAIADKEQTGLADAVLQ